MRIRKTRRRIRIRIRIRIKTRIRIRKKTRMKTRMKTRIRIEMRRLESRIKCLFGGDKTNKMKIARERNIEIERE